MNGTSERKTGTFRVKSGLAQNLKGGVIMDVVNAEVSFAKLNLTRI
jgi:pyridoxal 5'-phosphate synthase pdxS subunit